MRIFIPFPLRSKQAVDASSTLTSSSTLNGPNKNNQKLYLTWKLKKYPMFKPYAPATPAAVAVVKREAVNFLDKWCLYIVRLWCHQLLLFEWVKWLHWVLFRTMSWHTFERRILCTLQPNGLRCQNRRWKISQ